MLDFPSPLLQYCEGVNSAQIPPPYLLVASSIHLALLFADSHRTVQLEEQLCIPFCVEMGRIMNE
ncbi:hypothetical protein Ciccas_009929, partial [Cichlidogyrus casuarinus]